MRYLKLTKAVSQHGYVAEYYSADGVLVDTREIELSHLDKLVKSKIKLRVTKNNWGLIVLDRNLNITSMLPISKPDKVS